MRSVKFALSTDKYMNILTMKLLIGMSISKEPALQEEITVLFQKSHMRVQLLISQMIYIKW